MPRVQVSRIATERMIEKTHQALSRLLKSSFQQSNHLQVGYTTVNTVHEEH